jgi:hypothetical protein
MMDSKMGCRKDTINHARLMEKGVAEQDIFAGCSSNGTSAHQPLRGSPDHSVETARV